MDFKPLVNSSILNYLKEKKLEFANFDRLIIAEEPKVIDQKPKEEAKTAEFKPEVAPAPEEKK